MPIWICSLTKHNIIVAANWDTLSLCCLLLFWPGQWSLSQRSAGLQTDWLTMRMCSGWRRFLFCLPLIFFLPLLLSGDSLSLYKYYCGFYINISLRVSVFLLHISVLELHQDSTLEYPPKKQSKKSDHLVLGPAAGQGLPNRLQCEGSCSPFPYNMSVLSPIGLHFVDQRTWICKNGW